MDRATKYEVGNASDVIDVTAEVIGTPEEIAGDQEVELSPLVRAGVVVVGLMVLKKLLER